MLGVTMTGYPLPRITMFSHCLNLRGALDLCFAVSERLARYHVIILYHDCFDKVLASEISYYCSLVGYVIAMSKCET